MQRRLCRARIAREYHTACRCVQHDLPLPIDLLQLVITDGFLDHTLYTAKTDHFVQRIGGFPFCAALRRCRRPAVFIYRKMCPDQMPLIMFAEDRVNLGGIKNCLLRIDLFDKE